MMTNRDIVGKVFKGTNAYQLGAPDPTQVGIAKSFKWLYNPANRDWRNNTFVPNLINLIGTQILQENAWENPLASAFKRVSAPDRKGVEEMMVGLIKASAYSPKAPENLLTYNPPTVNIKLHTENRQDMYQMTVNRELLRPAFLAEGGLEKFISGVLAAPKTSDNRDEYNIMKDLLAKYDTEFGFYRVDCPALVNGLQSKDDVDDFIIKIQEYAALLTILSPKYNPDNMDTFTLPENLVLITTPDIYARINVKSLAQAFNVEYAKIRQRVVIVDEVPVEGVGALLLDERWFMCGDTVLQTTSFFNPANLATNYYLNHWGIYSVSPMVNAIAISNTGTTQSVVEVTPTTLEVKLYNDKGAAVENTAVPLNGVNYIKGKLTWTDKPEVEGFPATFDATEFTVTNIKIAQKKEGATAVILQPSDITGDVKVTAATFGGKVDHIAGKYTLRFNGADWEYVVDGKPDSDTLANLGVAGAGLANPSKGDVIIVTYNPTVNEHDIDTAGIWIDNHGELHIMSDEIVAGTTATIHAKSTYSTDGVTTSRYPKEYTQDVKLTFK